MQAVGVHRALLAQSVAFIAHSAKRLESMKLPEPDLGEALSYLSVAFTLKAQVDMGSICAPHTVAVLDH